MVEGRMPTDCRNQFTEETLGAASTPYKTQLSKGQNKEARNKQRDMAKGLVTAIFARDILCHDPWATAWNQAPIARESDV
jgi:hypothetical protein